MLFNKEGKYTDVDSRLFINRGKQLIPKVPRKEQNCQLGIFWVTGRGWGHRATMRQEGYEKAQAKGGSPQGDELESAPDTSGGLPGHQQGCMDDTGPGSEFSRAADLEPY